MTTSHPETHATPTEHNGSGANAQKALPAQVPLAAWSRPIGAPAHAGKAIDVQPALIDDGPYQGLPIGGMGSGAIGRTYRGDFARWHTEIGTHRYETAYADQFSIYIEQQGQSRAQVLWTERPEQLLQDWQWKYPREAGTYYALFPRAWFDYHSAELPVRLTQEQLSPVIPGNERESSFPVGAFIWRAENTSNSPVKLGIMLTWENFLGRTSHAEAHEHNLNRLRREAGLTGIEMRRSAPFSGEAWDGTIAIVAKEQAGVSITYRSRFAVDDSGADVWNDFAGDGQLDNIDDSRPGERGVPIAAALAVTFELQPGEVKEIPFALAWDQPIVTFPAGAEQPSTRWYKHYTRFFGRDGQSAWRIAAEALDRYAIWQREIAQWQQPILADTRRPEWYKTALFNELYFLVDGGTVWVDGPIDAPQTSEDGPGYFAYLECYDYPFYATHDVSFYSSWAILELWPNLERQEMLQFISTVDQEDLSEVTILATGEIAPRKLAGALPHDLGGPHQDPFLHANAYVFQNMNTWKDLNLKYVLRVYRDYLILDDRDFLDLAWPTIPVALEYVRKFDSDGDGLLDHHGADQTFDTWSMEGASAYTGGLLIAALEAASAIAQLQGDTARQQDYQSWLRRARASLEEKLWNGRYYLYNTGPTGHRDSIMADQLAGQWYAGALGLPGIAAPDRINTTLQTIFEYNVMGFADGTMGAVNGMRPNGEVDRSDGQAEEVWTGVTFALAALMLQEGLSEEAWRTAWGIYYGTYVKHGLWFRTPEAWRQDGSFRASMYMRPQSIWAIEHALRRS